MRLFSRAVAAVSAALVGVPLALVANVAVPPAEAADYKVLVVGKTLGFRHTSIDEATRAIIALGSANGFTVDVWDPPTATSPGQPDLTMASTPFTSAGLSPYAALVFVSTVDGTNDLDPARPTLLAPSELAALQGYIRAGGGFVGLHAATDAMHTVPWYGRLTGGGARFLSHPQQQWAVAVTEDPTHPSTATLPARWSRFDEWYNFTASPRADVHVLQTLDESTYSPGSGALGEDHPISWCQNFEGGRSWYQGMGHTEASYADATFRRNLLGGIQWAAGVAPGNCVTFTEVRTLITTYAASGRLGAAAAASIGDRLDKATEQYVGGSEQAAVAYLRQFVARAENQIRGDADDDEVRARLVGKAGQLIAWLQTLDTRENAPLADACPNGWSPEETVWFDGAGNDSGVPNRERGDGCTLLDAIWAAEPFATPAAFRSTVGTITRQFQRDGLLSAGERAAIVREATNSRTGAEGASYTDNSCAFRVALTFDDGPSAFRPGTLQTLRELRAPATFFDLGMRVAANPQFAGWERREGHTVLNHTMTHPNLTQIPAAQLRAQILDAEATLAAAGAPLPYKVMRPPFGSLNNAVRAELATLGYTPVNWNVSAVDWDVATTSAQLRDTIVAGLRPGAVVLMHDGPVDSAAGAAMAQALPQIVAQARERGLCFGRVDRAGQVVADRLVPTAEAVPAVTSPVPYLPLGATSRGQLPPAPYVIVTP